MAHILYLAHDLDDAAIWRRVAMMQLGGAKVDVAGFRRGEGPLPGPARVLGRTRNARMGQRVLAVARALLRGVADDRQRYDAVIARNLEMLALAVAAARGLRQADGRAPRLAYEVLDVHRLMLGNSSIGRGLRALERYLCHSVSLVVVSSPAFVSCYLDRYRQTSAPVLLVENKVLPPPEDGRIHAAGSGRDHPSGGPIVIGWFGILRCAFSLACLDAVTRAAPGRYRIVLRGRPALDVLPRFAETVAGNPDVVYGGTYRYPEDLAAHYSEVDLAWLVDRYDAGANSDWLLPNRLYESGASAVPPIYLAGTEIARAAGRMGVGIVVADPSVEAAQAALGAVDAERLAALGAAQRAVPATAWSADAAACRALVAALLEPRATAEPGLVRATAPEGTAT